MKFTENWYPPAKQLRLKSAIAAVPQSSGAIVEIGCWEGQSTTVIANEFAPELVHCVDHWRGDLTNPASGVTAKADKRDVHAQFQINMQGGTIGNYITHRSDWKVWAKTWNEPIRFLHLDAEHTYDQVTEQLRWATTVLTEIAVICGDDFKQSGVREAITKYSGLTRQQLTVPGPGSNVWATVVCSSKCYPLFDRAVPSAICGDGCS